MPDTDIDRVMERAGVAAEAARRADAGERAHWCESIARGLEREGERLIALAHEETHLPSARLTGELSRTVFQLRLLADEVRQGVIDEAVVDHADPRWGMGPRPDLRRINVSLGVVGVFGASNFPFAFSVLGGDSASALAAGCAVVHKVHSGHAGLGRATAEVAREMLAAAGAPDGLLQDVYGRAAGEAIVTHPLTRAVGFTGSTRVGRMLFDLASSRPDPIPFYGELGSTNPVFVTRSAWDRRRDEIIAGFASSLLQGMGQFCTKPGFLIVPTMGDGAEVLASRIASTERHEMLTPSLREHYAGAVAELRAVEGIDALLAETGGAEPPAFVLRADARRILAEPALFDAEMFGPAAVVVETEDDNDLYALARVLQGQLTATVHAEPEDRVDELVDALTVSCGRIVWNGWPTGVSVSFAQNHGGPYPAGTISSATSVGAAAVRRFVRPVAFQGFPQARLPERLRDGAARGLRRVDGRWETPPV